MSVKLYDLNMNEIIQRGIKWLELIPDPPQIERITESVWDGEITLGKKRLSRKLTGRFFFRGDDAKDYKLLRDELFALLDPLQDMYVVDMDVPGKRWLVDVDGQTLKRINRVAGEWEVTFHSDKPFAESIGTSLDPFTYDSGLWAYGMGLLEDASAQDYVHSSTEFSIYNPSDVRINPRKHELKITLKSITATGDYIRIVNRTSGDAWRYRGEFQAGDTITIDGIKTKRNGMNAVGNTGPTFELFSLVKGVNDFVVAGLTGEFEISFDFPFLYV